MDRRAFLKSSAFLGGMVSVPGLLAACGGGTGGATAGEIPEGDPSLVTLIASLELLTGQRRLAFGLRTPDNEPVKADQVRAYLRELDSDAVVAGPFEATYTEETGAGGLYTTQVSVNEPGTYRFVAVTGDGEFGEQAVNVVDPANSQAPVAGAEAISVATPTFDKDLGVAQVCTAEPSCPMHRTSLKQALDEGRPVMLLFATPEYCQTVVCGPAVENVDAVRDDREWGDVAWIHVEIYKDQGQTLTDAVQSWKLPTEPWLFAIGADGKIVDRLDGPMLPAWVQEMAQGLVAA